MSIDNRQLAGGFTNPLDDARLEFYLRNKVQIDQWASVAREVVTATNELLDGLGGEFAALAGSFAPDVSVCRLDPEATWPRFTFRRTSWPGTDMAPEVGVSVEWNARLIDPGTDHAPYVGIKVTNPAGAGSAFTQRFAEAAKLANAQQPAVTSGARPQYKRWSTTWPAVRTLVASEKANWWKDVPAWRIEMVAAVAETWGVLSPLIDNAMVLGDEGG